MTNIYKPLRPSDGSGSGQTAQLVCQRNHNLRQKGSGYPLYKTNTTVKCIYEVKEYGKIIPKWVDEVTMTEVECDDECRDDKECNYRGDYICVDGRYYRFVFMLN